MKMGEEEGTCGIFPGKRNQRGKKKRKRTELRLDVAGSCFTAVIYPLTRKKKKKTDYTGVF
jgi:hypothetical protein